tara:strand:+ start:183 stop:476 length:294 start_codon:yes stop_codon:yes gene_type:complete
MSNDTFFNIDFETPTPELELSVEMRCREVMKSDNFDNVKRYCTHLIRHQMRQDLFLAGVLGRLAELEALAAIKEMKQAKRKSKQSISRKIKKIFRIP